MNVIVQSSPRMNVLESCGKDNENSFTIQAFIKVKIMFCFRESSKVKINKIQKGRGVYAKINENK